MAVPSIEVRSTSTVLAREGGGRTEAHTITLTELFSGVLYMVLSKPITTTAFHGINKLKLLQLVNVHTYHHCLRLTLQPLVD